MELRFGEGGADDEEHDALLVWGALDGRFAFYQHGGVH
jgi:hypothetical protein